MYQSAKYLPVGDKALLVEFGNTVDLDVNRKVHALDQALFQARLRGVEECVPTYRSLLVYYDPSETSYERLIYRLKDLELRLGEFSVSFRKRVIDVPVAYGSEYGPDLGHVANYHSLREEEVVRLHGGRDYTVYMIGFLAGFPYLGEVADEIATPRLKTPRLRVPAGSVGIAEKQTGIYPRESPGGWQIVGRTPLDLFDVKKHPPALILPGDTVRFRPIGKEEFDSSSRKG
ncbi:MAG: 5-oxoprolinase subunit PxpB [Candidatus Bathyarchaeia archaeon]